MKVKIFLLIVLFSGNSLYSFSQAPLPIIQNRYAGNVLYVKFKDNSAFEVINSKLTSKAHRFISVSTTIDTAGYWRKVHRLSNEKLEELRQNAIHNLKKNIPDPNSEFYFYLNTPSQINTIKEELTLLPSVDRVLFVPILFNASPPDFEYSQTYLYPSNSGINAENVWRDYNNRGATIKLCDIEYVFDPNHIDLPQVTVLGPNPEDPFGSGSSDHGTAVLGQIASLNDGQGTTGIASDCELYFAGAFTDNTWDIASAITNALSTLSEGDVILIEQQTIGPNYTGIEQYGLVPVEWYQPWYDAITLAVGQNITVVEAAGNGSQDLDDPVYSFENGEHHPFMPGNSSGAILVGAGAVDPLYGGSDAARSRLYYSNYGSRLDLQGNGQRIVTTGYGDLFSAEGSDNYYTNKFGGTSGASPIVAGAVILLQSIYKSTFNTILTPEEIKIFLTSTGQPQQDGMNPATENIGPLPNIYASIQAALSNTGVSSFNSLNKEVIIYPNPSNDGIFNTISLVKESINIQVYNALSNLVWDNKTNKSTNIDLSNQPDGIYFVILNSGSTTATKKIIIER